MRTVNTHIGPGEGGYAPTTQRPEWEPLLRDPEWFVGQAGAAIMYAVYHGNRRVSDQIMKEFQTEWNGYSYDRTFEEYDLAYGWRPPKRTWHSTVQMESVE